MVFVGITGLGGIGGASVDGGIGLEGRGVDEIEGCSLYVRAEEVEREEGILSGGGKGLDTEVVVIGTTERCGIGITEDGDGCGLTEGEEDVRGWE